MATNLNYYYILLKGIPWKQKRHGSLVPKRPYITKVRWNVLLMMKVSLSLFINHLMVNTWSGAP